MHTVRVLDPRRPQGHMRSPVQSVNVWHLFGQGGVTTTKPSGSLREVDKPTVKGWRLATRSRDGQLMEVNNQQPHLKRRKVDNAAPQRKPQEDRQRGAPTENGERSTTSSSSRNGGRPTTTTPMHKEGTAKTMRANGKGTKVHNQQPKLKRRKVDNKSHCGKPGAVNNKESQRKTREARQPAAPVETNEA